MASVIVRDPDILGGRPVFRGTLVPVEVLFENLEDGLSIEEIVVPEPDQGRFGRLSRGILHQPQGRNGLRYKA